MKNIGKITGILIAASITMVLVAGCSPKTVVAAGKTGSNVSGNIRKFDPTAMKTSYETALKPLVTAGTITQDQSDKVLDAVTKNVPKASNQGTTQSNPQTDKQKNSQGQNRARSNPLSALVTSKVITQAQADAINQKIKDNMKNSKTNQTKQN